MWWLWCKWGLRKLQKSPIPHVVDETIFNFSAHWYLAIICFPWMQKPELLKLVTPEMIPAAEIKKEEEHASPVASSADPSSANPSSADPSSADPTQSADTAANNQEAADKPQTCTETKDDMEKKPSQDTEEEQPPEKKTPAEESVSPPLTLPLW